MGTNRSSRITIREVRDSTDPAVRAAYAILRATFAREERVAMREWVGSLREREAQVMSDLSWHLLVAERDGDVIGLASGTYVGSVNLGVIGYLATAPGLRARGLGSRLRDRLRRAFARDAARLAGRPLEGILGEVSRSNPWLRHLARRPEVLLLDIPYLQPRLYEDDQPSPFILYYESLQGVRARIPAAELRRILYAVWRRIYRIPRPLERPAFRAMLRALARRRWVGRLRLDDGPPPQPS